jgi:hypothetical protein
LKCSFGQEIRGEISQEAFAQVAAEKRIVAQEIQTIETDIEQLKQNFPIRFVKVFCPRQ